MQVTPLSQATFTRPAQFPACIVLDTNVVLDWLWFGDPRFDAVAAALLSRKIRWLATLPMRAELESVLNRLPDNRQHHSGEYVLTMFDLLAIQTETGPSANHLRCTDVDDQKFIDVAAAGANWLLSRDRALLQLGARASAFGLAITVPERWAGP